MEDALQKVHRFVGANVDIIDIGGESTRPGALCIPEEEEIQRVVPIIRAIRQCYPSLPVSIDTTKAAVAERAIQEGACILNDVSGLMADPNMFQVAIKYNIPTILMHMKFACSDRGQHKPLPKQSPMEVMDQIIQDLERLSIHAISQGLRKENIILDPGIGFGKNVDQNLIIIKHLDKIKELGFPVLVGLSRKSFIGYTTRAPIDKRLSGSIAANAIAIFKGADIVRVHDVAETIQAVQVADAIRRV